MLRILLSGLTLALWAISPAATALTYMAGLEQAQWQVSQSKLSCQLRQSIPRYGDAVFETKAGGIARFYLSAKKNPMEAGPTQLLASPPYWNPDAPTRELGNIEVADSERPVQLDAALVAPMLQALKDGLAPELARPAKGEAGDDEGRAQVRVALLPVRFNKAYAKYQECVGQLLPTSPEQVSGTVLEFANQDTQLSAAAQRKLDTLLQYIKADNKNAALTVDAMSADTPRRLDNLALAKQRVKIVSDYLTSRGVDEQRIKGSYRGERGRERRGTVTVKFQAGKN